MLCYMIFRKCELGFMVTKHKEHSIALTKLLCTMHEPVFSVLEVVCNLVYFPDKLYLISMILFRMLMY